jgi:hypothetical protein
MRGGPAPRPGHPGHVRRRYLIHLSDQRLLFRILIVVVTDPVRVYLPFQSRTHDAPLVTQLSAARAP